ncbi:MAG: glycosyltransferase family 2 protein [Candidatus Abyssobacteria bacterium SURF_17]|uniref:Glycosyltransferase family 2 protein n=1 Tax=Candidatus Abyssobacteria bacterium SURF_17 TaxID=2093361 RepID=A0A419ENV1_9BACT|nr:MAG: glycosyltransferase family 2 protein [Candidatus Abyssubacteria bacterium SURF_17]
MSLSHVAPAQSGWPLAKTGKLMNFSGKKILILVPAYNEADNIGRVLDEIIEHTGTLPHTFDILVVDDGSTDNTAEIVRAKGVEVISLPLNCGIGVALQTGFKFALESGHDILVRLDADGQHSPSSIGEILRPLMANEADLCIASRFINRQGYQASAVRRLGIAWFSFLISVFFRESVTDPTSGFQAMNRRLITLYSSQYASDYPEVEGLVNVLRNGLKVKEVSTVMKERQGGRSSIDWLQSVYYALKVTTVTFVSLLRR